MDKLQYSDLLDVVVKYANMYSEDTVVIGGGYASYLHLHSVGVNIEVKDLDVFVTTSVDGEERQNRWLNIMPNAVIKNPDDHFEIFTLVSEKGSSIDVFVNQNDDTEFTTMGELKLKQVEDLIRDYNVYLDGMDLDFEFYKTHPEYNDEYKLALSKFNRIKPRYDLLVKHFK